MKRIIRILFLLSVIGMMAFFTACEDDSSSTGTLNVKLIDAPVELDNGMVVEEVNLTITRVDVVKKGSPQAEEEERSADTEDEAEETEDAIKDGKGVSIVFEGEKSFNLLDYNEDKELDIGSLDLEAGDYLQLRFVIAEDACTIKFADDDTEYPLTIPSGTSSGLKLKGNGNNPLFTIEEGDDADLVFDLDAQASIEVATTKDGYKIKPVVKRVEFKNREREYDQE